MAQNQKKATSSKSNVVPIKKTAESNKQAGSSSSNGKQSSHGGAGKVGNMDQWWSQGAKAMEQAFGGMGGLKEWQEQAAEWSEKAAKDISKSADSAMKGWNESFAFNKDNMDAISESATIASKLSQKISSEISDLANDIIAENMKAAEAFLACKTVTDFFNLQNKFMANGFDKSLNQSFRVLELMMDYTKATEPLTERAQEAAEKITKSLSN